MDERQFQDLFLAVHKKEKSAWEEPNWEEKLEDCKRIIQELWAGEFKDLIDKDKQIFVRMVTYEQIGALASVADKEQNRAVINVSRKIWKVPRLKARLKQILRHEMLHISTGLGDKDLRFNVEAQERKVFPWDIQNYWG